MMEEKLTLDRLLPMAQARAEELMQVICEKEKILKKAPAGRLRLARRGRKAHYFHVTKNSSEWGDYIPAGESAGDAAIAALAQKDYDIHALAELRRELSAIDKFCRAYHPERLEALYAKLHDQRRTYVKPLWLPRVEFIAQWSAASYVGKPFSDDTKLLLTAKGERVRSKSEVIIADTLLRMGIPYRYEYPHIMKVGSRHVKFHPDFTCLRISDRSEILWEHLGMMDDPEYAGRTFKKMEVYEANGIFIGAGLIITQETMENPLSSATVQRLAEKFLLSK